MDEIQKEAKALKVRFGGMNRAGFAREHNFPGGDAMIYQHITGRRPMTLEAATIYSKAFGVALEEISPRLAKAVANVKSANPANDDNYVMIPRLDLAVAAGNGTDPEHVSVRETLAFRRDWLAKKGLNIKALEVYETTGDSMAPGIADGDVLLVDTEQTRPKNDEIWVIRQDAPLGYRVKRLLFRETGDIVIRSDHPDKTLYPDEVVTAQNAYTIQTVGKVVWRGG